MVGLLTEVAGAVARRAGKGELILVDAAAGKATVGLLAAELILAPSGRPARVCVIEREPARVAACREAIARLRAPGRVGSPPALPPAGTSGRPSTPPAPRASRAPSPAADHRGRAYGNPPRVSI